MSEPANAPTAAPAPLAVEHTVTVQDSIMVAHSLRGEVFGPAQRLHGATYVVRATFRRDGLDDDGIVVDIGAAAEQLRAVLADLDYTNLDEHPELAGVVTTTEVLAAFIASRLVARAADGLLRGAGRDLTGIDVSLGEKPDAAAACRVRLREPGTGAATATPGSAGAWPWTGGAPV